MAVRSSRPTSVVGLLPRASVVVAAACLLTACSEGVEPRAEPSPSPSSTASADEATASAAAVATPTRTPIGAPATITVSKGNRSGEVAVTVTKVRKGSIKDLSDFVLDHSTRRSTPYYADVRVTNTSSTNLAGAKVPLWGLDATGTVLPAARVRGTFGKCDDQPLPKKFTKGERARTCLLFLVPKGGALQAVQYRPSDETAGVVSWPVG